MPRPLLLPGGSVVDVRTGSVAVRSIPARDGRIAAVGDGESTADAERVDVTGVHRSRDGLDAARTRPAAGRRAA